MSEENVHYFTGKNKFIVNLFKEQCLDIEDNISFDDQEQVNHMADTFDYGFFCLTDEGDLKSCVIVKQHMSNGVTLSISLVCKPRDAFKDGTLLMDRIIAHAEKNNVMLISTGAPFKGPFQKLLTSKGFEIVTGTRRNNDINDGYYYMIKKF